MTKEPIYLIWDSEDGCYVQWYATKKGIEQYLEEIALSGEDDDLIDFNNPFKSLSNVGLSFEEIKIERGD